MLSLIFVYSPATFPKILTEMVQDAVAAKLPPLQVIVGPPAMAVTVPLQVVDRPLGVATRSPLGRLSVKPTPLKALVEFGLLMLKVRVLAVP
jgi:hypothetical protein